MKYYVEDPDGKVKEAENYKEMLKGYNDRWRHQSELQLGDETVMVSTVFLGIDHNFFGEGPPLLYETMVFCGDLDQEYDRYSTREEALVGHDEMLERVINSRSLPEANPARMKCLTSKEEEHGPVLKGIDEGADREPR